MIGCGSLLLYEPTLAEVRSLAVAPVAQGLGLGKKIVTQLIAEARTREAQKQLFDAIESIPAGFILFDKDGRLNVWNTKAPDFLPANRELVRIGVKYEELIRSSAESGHVIGIQNKQEIWIAIVVVVSPVGRRFGEVRETGLL